jgi:hypothetical protein
MVYREQSKEEESKAKKESFNSTVRQRAEEIRQTKYNIISQQGPPRKIDTFPRHDKSNVPRDWHFLSHLTLDDHASASIHYDESYNLERAHRKPPVGARAPQRAFDIISNKFRVNDRERLQEDNNHKREYILNKYWSTHDYDIVKGQYCDDKKESTFRDQRALLCEIQGEAQSLRLPPRSVVYTLSPLILPSPCLTVTLDAQYPLL